MLTLTPNDLRNPSRKSGFDHVNSNTSATWRAARGGKRRFAGGPETVWRGPTRRTAQEAAQDYCDYMNGQGLAATATLKSAGHEYTIDESDKDPEYQAALGVLRDRRAQREGKQGYVYLITEALEGGRLRYGKIGYSVNPKKRVAELQTGNPRALVLLYAMPGTEDDERDLHAKYVQDNIMQEWFLLTPELILEFPLSAAVGVVGSCPAWAQKGEPATA